MKSKWLTLFIIAMLILSIIVGCGKKGSQGSGTNTSEANTSDTNTSETNTSNEYEFKEGKYYATGDKQIEITWLMRDDEQQSLNVQGKFFKDVLELTGVKIKAQSVVPKNLTNAINLALASGDLPDIIQGNDEDIDMFLRYGMEGAFLPVGDIIEKYAPNLKAKLFDDPRYREARMWSTAVDGKQYVIPSLRNEQGYGQHFTIRKDLLEKYNIPMPATFDELYEFMKFVQPRESEEMAKEGRKFYAFATSDFTDFKYVFYHFDVAKDWVVENGKVFYGPADPRYKEALEWLHTLYKEGMMPQEIFSFSENQYYELYYNGSLGVGLNSLSRIKRANEAFQKIHWPKGKKYYVVLVPPLKTKAGNVYPNAEPFQKQPIVISAKTKYPVECVRLIDWFFTEEGYLLAKEGIALREGIGPEGALEEFYADYKPVKEKYPDWYEKSLQSVKDAIAEGAPGMTDQLTEDGELAGYFYRPSADRLTILYQYGWFSAQCPAGIVVRLYNVAVDPIAMDETRKAVLYLTERFPDPVNPLVTSLGTYPFRFVRFTQEEAKRVGDLYGNILTVVDEYMAKFVTGKISFDEWDKYIAELKSLGLDELVEIYNNGYQRYIAGAKK